jgi:hypothetical protein
MNKNRGFSAILMLVFLVTVLVALPASARGRAVQSAGGKDNQGVTDEGTVLSALIYNTEVECRSDGSGADVTLDYSVISTAAANSAELTLVVDGDAYAIGTIASGNIDDGGGWTFSGRTKTAEGSVSHFLESGQYFVQVCATQSGAQGRLPKTACSDAVSVVVPACPSSTECSVHEFFGNIVTHNVNCTASNTIPIQFRGNFGPSATLAIDGPSGYYLNVSVARSGDSCNYTNNDWSPSVSGTYTIRVNGGLSVDGGMETSETITCKTKP